MAKVVNPSAATAAPKTSGSRFKRVALLAVVGAGILGFLAAANSVISSRQEEVSVIRLVSSLKAGDVITESVLEEYPMLKKTYDELGMVEIDEKEQQVIIPWSEKDEVVGKYMSNYLSTGSYLSTTDLTTEITIRNPWVKNMDPDEEIYTMSFAADSVNARLLYPGTRLRARLINTVPIDQLDSIHSAIAADEANSDTLVRPSTVLSSKAELESEAADVAVAEIVISEIIITDMTNGNGESIYDLYMSLLKLPINDRLEYLETSFASDSKTATSWQKRVTPATITFILDKESASLLAEFEQSGGTIKYTILPDKYDDDTDEDAKNLMSQFVEISNQINTQTDTAQGG